MSFDSNWNAFMYGLGNDIANELAKVAPVATSQLKNNIDANVNGDIITITMPEHGMFVEFGTPPHIIRPKNGKVLAFPRSGSQRVQHNDGTISGKFTFGGKTIKTDAVFAKVVHHPGTRPNPFIRTTFDTKVPGLVEKNIGKAFK